MNVRGNTFCINTGMTYIPFYKINDEEIIMLDTGWADGERDGITKLLESNNFKVKGIICTHAHIDHIGSNTYLKNKYKCVIAMPAYEAQICMSSLNLKVYYNNQTLSSVEEHFKSMVCETDIMIADNQDKIYVSGIKFGIVHTPGHSPAHICIITPDDVAYIGDALISENVMKGAKMPYAFILKEDLKSKVKLYGLRCSKYILAHKGIYDNITDLITENINFYKGRAAGVYGIIEGSMSMEEIMKAAIDKFNIHADNTSRYIVIERMVKSYVEYLEETGVIHLNMEDGFAKYSRKPAE